MDAFAPIGPAVVTKDEILDPHNLHLSCTVNGLTKQVCILFIWSQVIYPFKIRTRTQVNWCLEWRMLSPGSPSASLSYLETSYSRGLRLGSDASWSPRSSLNLATLWSAPYSPLALSPIRWSSKRITLGVCCLREAKYKYFEYQVSIFYNFHILIFHFSRLP